MSKTLVIIKLVLLLSISSYSQKASISGYIIDKNTGETLIGANIYDVPSNIGSISNKFGYFTLFLNKNMEYTLQFSYIGYTSKSYSFKIDKDTMINIELVPDEVKITEVIVRARNEKKIEEKAEISKISIPVSEIKLLPSITGEPDILKAYQLVPGIQSGTEGNNGLYVRGGTPDQNLFLLDDVPLYNVSHLGGLFSVFDPSMVKSIDMYKGGFPARYGGRISSVVDVRNKEGNLYSYKGEIGLSLFLSKIFIVGPLIKEKSSFAFSVRRSNLDIYSFLYNRLASNQYNNGYTFYDISLKSNLKLSQNNRLFISLYNGRDKFYFKENDIEVENSGFIYTSKSNLYWGNSAASMRWLHIFKNNVFNNMTFAYTKYVYNNQNHYSRKEISDNSVITDNFQATSSINDVILKNDTEISLEKLKFRLGTMLSKHFYVPSFVSYSQKYTNSIIDSTLISPNQVFRLEAFDLLGYIEWECKFVDKISANMGLRAGSYFINSTNFPSFEPRFVFNYLFLPSVSFKASFCTMQQNIHLLTNSNTGLPSDIWVPSTALLKPESSNQYSIGLAHTMDKGYEISIEAYYKESNNLIEYKEGILLYNSTLNWEEKVEKGGTGKMKGMEFMINKKSGTLTGWFGYSLSSNKRTFLNINNGREFPFKYEQSHNISVVGNYRLSKRFTLSCTWVYHTGNKITLPSGKYQLYNINYSGSYEGDRVVYSDVHIYSEKNGYRMPDYHRLDIGLNFTKSKRKGTAIWTLGIYNAYNRQNAYYLFFKETGDGTVKLYQQCLYPILINLGYSFSF